MIKMHNRPTNSYSFRNLNAVHDKIDWLYMNRFEYMFIEVLSAVLYQFLFYHFALQQKYIYTRILLDT